MVNKRNFPEYFELIKEPMALSKIKQKMTNKEYTGFQEFVRDCALVGLTMPRLLKWN
jgi:chromatin structure-remodeling complex subunit RSC1/2